MYIYIEHNGEFYDHSDCTFDEILRDMHIFQSVSFPRRKTDKRDFEIGARVYFEDAGWTEVVEENGCEGCAFSKNDFRSVHWHCTKTIIAIRGGAVCDGIIFKKLDISEKSAPAKSEYYILNEKTYYTKFAHTTESEARKEAERLAIKQPGDSFKILKVVAECTGKVEIEWK